MINWFGPASWGAPVCDDAPRCDTPVGIPCCRCARAIAPGDEGITMPGSGGPVAFHLACHLKSVLPHRQWREHGLVPDETDGLVNGAFRCRTCGIAYTTAHGWGMIGGDIGGDLPDCTCRTPGCGHRASEHGLGGVCRICGRACWS